MKKLKNGIKDYISRYRISRFKSIYDYIRRGSKKYANLEVRKIKLFIDSLSNFPLKGKYFETKKGVEILSIVFRIYIIFYKVTDKEINILSIHHHARLVGNTLLSKTTNNPIFAS